MMPPIVQWMNASPTVVSLLKPASVMRVFRDEIPETEPQPATGPAAAVYSLVSGTSEKQFDCKATADYLRIQFDVYAKVRSNADAVATAIRDVLEDHGYVNLNFTERDVDTRNYRVSMDFLFWDT